jgi:hypothetical protein
MSEIASASINSFGTSPKANFESPSEEAVFITSSQLQDLITKALQPLQNEVAALREERDQDRREFAVLRGSVAALEARVTLQEDNGLIQLRLINSLREILHKEQEKPAPAPTRKTTQKTEAHITEIAAILGAKEKRLIEGQAPRAYVDRLRKEGMTFSELANVLGLTTDRIRQLAKIASGDQRFNITWHPRKKNCKIIKLRRWDTLGL